ncbi:sensor histidine kinase [Neptuniibacter sp.]|uniref:sensor histidine kinase n=1 Tax=Neptuniibacter sp. TaxID=1962643 RepID=UPI00261AA7C0|nr:sensor histidine kinase [Neptuniibacter sp.]MCP4597946.1 sensor histidine kinase [Neptuniibacter sp.]
MFKISARAVLELGSELISSDIIAFYELIKNGFDARTKSGVSIEFNVLLRRNAFLTLSNRIEVDPDNFEKHKLYALKAINLDANNSDNAQESIKLSHTPEKLLETLQEIYNSSTITISDTGSGMSSSDLENNFLVIGTSSRKKAVDEAIKSKASRSPYLGEKGIGRLSAMRLGDHLRVETATEDDSRLNILDIDWNEFSQTDAMLSDISVTPSQGQNKNSSDWSGTKIIIGKLSEDWTKTRLEEMAKHDFSRLTDPFKDAKKRPRVALSWNEERIKIPWMNKTLLEHAQATVKGSYSIENGEPVLRCKMTANNLGFDHPKEEEETVRTLVDLEGSLIGTDSEIHDDALLNLGDFSFEAHWFNRQRLKKIESIGSLKDVRALQRQWSGIMLFRDDFRVFPYGDDDDDWLALDRKALARSGYALNKTQFIGKVCISRTTNPMLVDQTNREGLRETQEQKAFLEVMSLVIQDELLSFMKRIEKQYKNQKIDLSTSKAQIATLEQRAKGSLGTLRKKVPKEGKEAIEDLQQTLFEFSDFAKKAKIRIEEVEQESRQMIEMAGVGLMVEVVAHELARASENAISNLNDLKGSTVPDSVQKKLESLRSQMKSLSKRIKVLDPLSVSGRQRKESFSLNELIQDTLEAHSAQFDRHHIQVNLDLADSPIRVNAVKGMIVQILENLISNSKYWMEMKAQRNDRFIPTISISSHDSPPTIIFEDNGRGIAPENREKVFQVFFSLKEKTKRRGLGLFIAKECAQYNDGILTLDETPSLKTKRLHRFILELPEKKITK